MNVPVRLFLVRHAQAEANHPLGDAARRLTADGREAFRSRAEEVARQGRITRILTSPYARARETAAILSAACGAPVEEAEALASGRSDAQALVRLARTGGDGTAIVGHNPEIAGAIALVAGRELPVPPGTVACLEVGSGDSGWPRLAWLS